mgnify:FL=1
MKVKLKIKQFNNGAAAVGNFFPLEKHIPDYARKEQRRKIYPGEVFTVDTKEEANFYLKQGHFEVVLDD